MFVPCHFVLGSIYTSEKTVNLQSIQIGFIEGKPSPVSLALGRPLKPFLWTCLPWIYICKLSIIEVLLSSFFFFQELVISCSPWCLSPGLAGSTELLEAAQLSRSQWLPGIWSMMGLISAMS